MLSVPVAVHHPFFKWQLDLFWYAHKAVYGEQAKDKALAAIVTANTPLDSPGHAPFGWDLDIPFVTVAPYYETLGVEHSSIKLPLNIQVSLLKVLETADDDELIEVLDCDMFHFRPAPELDVPDDMLLVSPVYEAWHLKSKGEHKHVIEPYFEHDGRYYNGGFVPIIGRARTFKKIMREWIAVHVDILSRNLHTHLHWWAGMFALSAACEKARVTMVAHDVCAVPPDYPLQPNHYVTHYSVDPLICKKTFLEGVELNRLPDQVHYNLFKLWYSERHVAGS